MKKCESLIVISPNASDEEVKQIVEHTAELIQKIGKVTYIQYIGVQKPKSNVVGYGFIFGFKTKLHEVEELEIYYKDNEKIIYDLTVRLGGEKWKLKS